MQAQHGNQGRQIPNQVEDILQQQFLKLVCHDRTVRWGHNQNVEKNPYDVASDEQAEQHVELVLGAANYHIAQGNLLEHQCEPDKWVGETDGADCKPTECGDRILQFTFVLGIILRVNRREILPVDAH